MQAYAEGLNVLKHANVGNTQQEADAETTPLRDPDHYRYDLDLAAVTEGWRRGAVTISSWLGDLTAAALVDSPALDGFAGRVSDSGEGRWTLHAAIDESIPAPGALGGAVRALQLARGGRVPPTGCCPPCGTPWRSPREAGMTLAPEQELENPLLEGLGIARTPESCALVIFGASGDLTHKKLFPALYSLAFRQLLPRNFASAWRRAH